MRIITWNCNMAFRKKFDKIIQLNPDLLILQECENDEKLKEALKGEDYNQILWLGNNPHKGVGAISFNSVEISFKSDYNPEFEYIIPLHVKTKNKEINLLSIWAMPHKTERSKSYVGQIWGAINYYAESFNEPSILIGDFNSNAIWDKKYRIGNHSNVVEFLKEKEITSLYHKIFKVEHGHESDPTLFLLKNKEKPYHLDYFFASEKLISNKTSLRVGAFDDWIKLSDHMPIIIESLVLE